MSSQTRRAFLRMTALGAAGLSTALLAACGGAGAVSSLATSAAATSAPSAATSLVTSSQTARPGGSATTTTRAATTAVAASTSAPKAGGQAVTISVLVQDFQPKVVLLKQAIEAFKQKQPQVTVNIVEVGYSDLPTKVKTEMAAGTGPEVLQSYSDFWRGTDASQVFLALTPELFSRSELETLCFPTLLDSVPAKRKEVYLLPYSDGLNGDALLYNPALLSSVSVDPKSLTTIDAIIGAGAKLTVSQGGQITREGIWFSNTSDPVRNWILDQGATFYDEQNHKWTWQTDAAAAAMQKVVDVYQQGTSWVKAPAGVKQPIGESKAALELGAGFYELSGDATAYPHLDLADMPAPSFVPGKPPHYFQTAISAWALSALLKLGDAKTDAAVAFLRHLYTPDEVMAYADQYSGAILIQGVYTSPAFKSTKFGPVRGFLPDQVIAHTLTMDMAVEPGFSTQMNKVIAGTMSIQAALAEMQQIYSSKEEEARKNMPA